MILKPTNRTPLLATVFVSLMGTLCLYAADDGRTLHPDIVQAISGARNLLAGNGYSTDLIYYEQHYQQQFSPARQTVFPFGYSGSLALLALSGISFHAGAQVLSLTGFFLVPILIFLNAKKLGRSSAVAVVTAILWQCSPMIWMNVHEKQTETLFTAFTLASLLFLLPREPKVGGLLAAGLCAAVACTLRYAGIFWVMALTAAILPGPLREWKQRLCNGIVLLLLPVATVLGMFLRNQLISGDLRGGIRTIEMKSWRLALENVYYALSRLVGLDQDALQQLHVAELLAGLGGTTMVLLLVVGCFRSRQQLHRLLTTATTGRTACYAYLMVTIGCLSWLEKSTTVNLSPRMLLPVLPFALLAAGEAVDLTLHCLRGITALRWMTTAACGASLAGVLLAQADVYEEVRHQPRRLGMVADILKQSVDQSRFLDADEFSRVDIPLPASLAEVIRGHRILTNEAHMLPAVTGEGALGLTADVYTSRRWTTAEVEMLARQHDIEFIVLFTFLTPRDSNEFFDALIADYGDEALPDWLSSVLVTEELRIYRVRENGPQVSMTRD